MLQFDFIYVAFIYYVYGRTNIDNCGGVHNHTCMLKSIENNEFQRNLTLHLMHIWIWDPPLHTHLLISPCLCNKIQLENYVKNFSSSTIKDYQCCWMIAHYSSCDWKCAILCTARKWKSLNNLSSCISKSRDLPLSYNMLNTS